MVRESGQYGTAVHVEGDLRDYAELRHLLDEVREVMRRSAQATPSGTRVEGAIRVDLSGLTDMNSALLAALIALGAEAIRCGAQLSITGEPKFFQDYAQTLGVEGVLARAFTFESQP